MDDLEFLVGLDNYFIQSDEDYWKCPIYEIMQAKIRGLGAEFDEEKGEWFKDDESVL